MLKRVPIIGDCGMVQRIYLYEVTMNRFLDDADVMLAMTEFLSSGGYKSTRAVHEHLKNKGYKVKKKHLLKLLNLYAEPGGYVYINWIRQKSWII